MIARWLGRHLPERRQPRVGVAFGTSCRWVTIGALTLNFASVEPAQPLIVIDQRTLMLIPVPTALVAVTFTGPGCAGAVPGAAKQCRPVVPGPRCQRSGRSVPVGTAVPDPAHAGVSAAG